ncbi:MAG TPA: glycosyltransferase family 9 protein [Steroidobacteraceae bacterium]|nr:glycosyltransferase family 9 protein [Steroidobacteraceae bacterium]
MKTHSTQPSGAQSHRRRIAVLRVGSLGDHLIALPLYRRLRELHADDELSLVSNIPAQGNPKLIGPASILPEGLFDAILGYPVGSGLRQLWDTYRLFRGQHIDLLYYMMPARSPRQLQRDRLFFRTCGVKVQGLSAKEATAAEAPRYLPDRQLYEHEMHRIARAIPALADYGIPTARELSLELSGAERAECANWFGSRRARRTIAISLGTKLEVNRWGVDKWRQLVGRLAADDAADRLLLIGSNDEAEESEIVRREWRRESFNLCGRLTLRQSAAAIASAQLFVGHDSGPMHVAAAVEVPIVAVFSARNPPGMWFPLSQNCKVHYTRMDCMGCGRLRCDDLHKACIRDITVEAVYASCLRLQHQPPRLHVIGGQSI